MARDIEKAMVVRQLFEKLATEREALGDLIPPRATAKPLTLSDWLVSIRKAFSGAAQSELREKLKTSKKHYEYQNYHDSARAIGNLIAILERWAEIGGQLSPKPQP